MKLISVKDSFTKSLVIFIAYKIPFRNFAIDMFDMLKNLILRLFCFDGILDRNSKICKGWPRF